MTQIILKRDSDRVRVMVSLPIISVTVMARFIISMRSACESFRRLVASVEWYVVMKGLKEK